MSEDRHTFSEARPVPGLERPTWDVDVFRDSVPEPILTLRIDNTNLPPRKSKKKKVAWKLPDTIDELPRFGVDEKSRLLELFKNVKKERRKSKQQKRTNANEMEGMDDQNYEDSQGTNNDKSEEALGNGRDVQQQNDGDRNINKPTLNGDKKEQPTFDIEHLALEEISSTSQQESRTPPGFSSSKPPPGLSHTQSMPLPPGITIEESAGVPESHKAFRAPPGMGRSQSTPMDGNSDEALPLPPGITPPTQQNSSENFSGAAPNSQEQKQQQQQQHSLIHPEPGNASGPLISPCRFFSFAPTMPDDIFALQVANAYITMLQSGQVDELLLYYSLTAQKSLSLKSAHSTCATLHEMKTQLQSLVSCAFVVHGVTLQRSIHNSILLVWSGVCQVQRKPHGFTQTLILMPTSGTRGMPTADDDMKYQIQNDALVLLANEQ